MYEKPRRIRFGAAYYHEYQPSDRLKTDLDLMAKAGFSVIRVGESVWSTWEPESGRFDLEWLLPVLDGAHERGIDVVLGTPTYAVPPWLARTYPEIAGERSTGRRIGWGARQEADFTHPAFRFHAERVTRHILARYAGHPSVVGFQVDNEPGNELLHNHGVFQRFIDWLRARYGDVETLNREWGLVYWSHRLSTWADLWTPDGNAQPQYDLAWRQFQAEQTTEFIAWQAAIVREYAGGSQFVTTCLSYDRPAIDDRAVTLALDVSAGNPYYSMQDALALPNQSVAQQHWTTTGTWALYLSADRMFSSKQAPFLVTETNAQSIGYSWNNRPAYDGQWRQAAWALISRGAEMIEYWHWHTLHFGAETYWGGVLPHSGQPGRVYREISQIGHELAAAGEHVVGLTPHADIAFLYSAPSKWALDGHPALALPDGGPDHRSYQGFFEPFYRGAFDAGLQARVLHAEQVTQPGTMPAGDAAANYPVLVVAGLYLADDETLDWLTGYAAAGGHLIVGPHTGYADLQARARPDIMPARLSEAAGAWYEEYSNLSAPLPLTAADAGEATPSLSLHPEASATRWVDGLVADNAEVLAHYQHPHFGQWPAVTSRVHDAGRITLVGTVPDQVLAQDLFQWVADNLPHEPWRSSDPAITIFNATNQDGQRLRFVHNWSWKPSTLVLPAEATDVLGGQAYARGDELPLGPWDVRVLMETPPLA
jgi:beta-galactosidase